MIKLRDISWLWLIFEEVVICKFDWKFLFFNKLSCWIIDLWKIYDQDIRKNEFNSLKLEFPGFSDYEYENYNHRILRIDSWYDQINKEIVEWYIIIWNKLIKYLLEIIERYNN